MSGPVIIIEDDGSGMNRDVIENGWLRPASTLKTNIKERLKRERAKALQDGSLAQYDSLIAELKKANKNRIPLGEKGVGRFATHRLGQYLIIKTKTAELSYEYVLSIDWNRFDDYAHVAKSADANVTVRDAIFNLPLPSDSLDPVHRIVSQHSQRVMERIKLIPKDGGSRKDLPEEFVLPWHSGALRTIK